MPGGAHRALDVSSGLLVAATAVAVFLLSTRASYDDAFITYRYAQNLANGEGFVYNAGEPLLGTTAPGYGLLLGLLGLPDPDAIPGISAVLSGLSLVAAGLGIYAYARLDGERLLGVLAAVLFVSHPLLPLTIGGEMLMVVALVVWALVLSRLGWTAGAAAIFGLAIVVRPDSVVAAGVAGLAFAVSRRRLPWREATIVLAIVLPFVLAGWAYYGSPLPQTLEAKRALGDHFDWRYVEGLLGWIAGPFAGRPPTFDAPNLGRYVVLGILGLYPLLLFFRSMLLVLAWPAALVAAHLVLGVTFSHWYAVPVVAGLAILAACGLAGLVRIGLPLVDRLSRPALRRWAPAAAAGLLLALLAPGIAEQLRAGRGSGPGEARIDLYVATGRWFREHTPPGASIGHYEIGYIGYHARRRLVDALGLVTEGPIAHVRRGDFLWAYRRYRPDYIADNQPHPQTLLTFSGMPWVKGNYTQVAKVSRRGMTVLILKRRSRRTLAGGTEELRPSSPRPTGPRSARTAIVRRGAGWPEPLLAVGRRPA